MVFQFLMMEVLEGLTDYGAHHGQQDGPAAIGRLPDLVEGGG